MQDRILKVCCAGFALLVPMAGLAAEKRAPEFSQIREWLRASGLSPVFSARESRRRLHVLPGLPDGSIPVVAYAWLPETRDCGASESSPCQASRGMRRFEVLAVLLGKDGQGRLVDRGHRLMNPADLGAPEPAATALVVYPRVGDFNGDDVPELYLRIRRTWVECGCGAYARETLRIFRLDSTLDVEFVGREQAWSGCLGACYDGAGYGLDRRHGTYRLIETAVRCVPPKVPGPAGRPVAYEQKTVLGWSVAKKAWRPVKQHPEKVRDDDAE